METNTKVNKLFVSMGTWILSNQKNKTKTALLNSLNNQPYHVNE